MDLLDVSDSVRARQIDRVCQKNKWRNEWLDEKDKFDRPFRLWLRKTTEPGASWCRLCSKKLVYKSNGKKSLEVHSIDTKHVERLNALKHTSTLPSAIPVLAPLSKVDSLVDAKIRTCTFLAEHCLPLSLAPDLIAFCQKLAADTQCLENLAMCRKTATYTMTHGVAADFRDNLCERLRKTHFSLNIDEATNNSNNKVVNVLVRYFNDEKGVVITQLLGSFIENVATAQNIFAGLMSLIEPLEPAKCLPKENIVSCLMDNCNVMRGKKGGLETLICDEQPHLLDVHGDTVHIVSNAAKEFCKPFSNYLEGFASDVYYDFKLSPKATELFMEVCSLLHVEGAVRPIRPVGSRFLQMLDVSERLHKILDPLMVFQYAFLLSSEQKIQRKKLEKIFEERNITAGEQARLAEVWKLSKGCYTAKSDRKDRILLRLLGTTSGKTMLLINLYRGVLPKFQNYLKLYQSDKPMLHTLHVDMYRLTRDFLCLFLKSDVMPKSFRVSDLMKIDCTDPSNQVSDRNLTVGCHAYHKYHSLHKCSNKPHWFHLFLQQLRSGYQNACVHLQTKLPLDNTTLSNLSALDPEMHGSEKTVEGLRALADKLPNVICAEETGTLYEEVRMYNSCEVISSYLPLYLEQGKCIDQHWWHRVLQLKTEGKTRYPLLKRLVSALLSIFTGPLVEATFNIMDDIVENDRTMLTSENYEAVALIKSGLRADKKDSTTMPITHKMRKTCTSAYSAYKEFLETKKLQKEELKQKRIQAALHKLGMKTPKDKSQTREFNRVQKIGDKAKQSRNPVPVNKSTAHPTSDSSNKPKRYVIPKVQSTDNSESAPCVSRATDRESYFKTIAGKLQKASKKSFYQLQELAKEVEKDIDKWPVSCVQGLDASHYSTDEKAADLFPKDAPALLPISIEGDGNCLPRCAALLATVVVKRHMWR
ncbi:hypothetical protein ACOMHN_058977 [Nucella lapillus]